MENRGYKILHLPRMSVRSDCRRICRAAPLLILTFRSLRFFLGYFTALTVVARFAQLGAELYHFEFIGFKNDTTGVAVQFEAFGQTGVNRSAAGNRPQRPVRKMQNCDANILHSAPPPSNSRVPRHSPLS
jgi:hypothetical protein